jgi:hypothetical protein
MVGPANQSPTPERDPTRDVLGAPPVSLQSISAIVEAGASAPSGDNCQPWRFRWNGEALLIVFVPERAESFYDVDNIASWVSLGALLENVALAAEGQGLRPAVELSPESGAGNVVGRISFTPKQPARSPLLTAIPGRSVNRRPYRHDRLPAAVSDELLVAGRGVAAVKTRLIEDPQVLSRLAALAALNDRVLFENRALHAGLQRWLRWTPEEALRTHDGMPIESLELARIERPGFRMLSAWPCARLLGLAGGTRLLPLRARRAYLRSAAVGLVSVNREEAAAFIEAGRVVERIWLTATLRQVAFQPITGITFLLLRLWLKGGAGLRPGHRRLLDAVGRQLREMLGLGPGELPVMLFRVGFADPPTARALRLPVSDLLTITGI